MVPRSRFLFLLDESAANRSLSQPVWYPPGENQLFCGCVSWTRPCWRAQLLRHALAARGSFLEFDGTVFLLRGTASRHDFKAAETASFPRRDPNRSLRYVHAVPSMRPPGAKSAGWHAEGTSRDQTVRSCAMPASVRAWKPRTWEGCGPCFLRCRPAS